MPKPSFERSLETKLCLDMILKLKVNDQLSWGDIEKALGVDRESARSYMDSARRIAENEHGIVVDSVRGSGFIRLSDSSVAKLHFKANDHIRRTAGKTIKKLSCVTYDALSEPDKVTHNAGMTIMSLFRNISKPKNVKAIEGAVEESRNRLPVGKALRLLGVKEKDVELED